MIGSLADWMAHTRRMMQEVPVQSTWHKVQMTIPYQSEPNYIIFHVIYSYCICHGPLVMALGHCRIGVVPVVSRIGAHPQYQHNNCRHVYFVSSLLMLSDFFTLG